MAVVKFQRVTTASAKKYCPVGAGSPRPMYSPPTLCIQTYIRFSTSKMIHVGYVYSLPVHVINFDHERSCLESGFRKSYPDSLNPTLHRSKLRNK